MGRIVDAINNRIYGTKTIIISCWLYSIVEREVIDGYD